MNHQKKLDNSNRRLGQSTRLHNSMQPGKGVWYIWCEASTWVNWGTWLEAISSILKYLSMVQAFNLQSKVLKMRINSTYIPQRVHKVEFLWNLHYTTITIAIAIAILPLIRLTPKEWQGEDIWCMMHHGTCNNR